MASKESELSDKERELIDKAARWIADSGLQAPIMMLMQTIKPLSTIGGELGYFFLAPFLPLLDEKGYEFLDTFEKRENIERVMRRVEKLTQERGKKRDMGFWKKVKETFSF